MLLRCGMRLLGLRRGPGLLLRTSLLLSLLRRPLLQLRLRLLRGPLLLLRLCLGLILTGTRLRLLI